MRVRSGHVPLPMLGGRHFHHTKRHREKRDHRIALAVVGTTSRSLPDPWPQTDAEVCTWRINNGYDFILERLELPERLFREHHGSLDGITLTMVALSALADYYGHYVAEQSQPRSGDEKPPGEDKRRFRALLATFAPSLVDRVAVPEVMDATTRRHSLSSVTGGSPNSSGSPLTGFLIPMTMRTAVGIGERACPVRQIELGDHARFEVEPSFSDPQGNEVPACAAPPPCGRAAAAMIRAHARSRRHGS